MMGHLSLLLRPFLPTKWSDQGASGLQQRHGCSSRKAIPLAVAVALIWGFGGVGCTKKRQTEPNVELIQDMMDQPAIKAQDYDTARPDQPGSRLPPDGTVPKGYTPYPYHNDPEGAEKLKNPLNGDFSPETLARGQKRYETFCTPCHGSSGNGAGLVAPKMVLKPANLNAKIIADKSDGHYFHTITDGYGGMGSYASQIVDETDRWAIVNYVRSLQKIAGVASGADATKSGEKKR